MTRSLPDRTRRLAAPPGDAGSWLLTAARQAIAGHLGDTSPAPPAPEWAMDDGACFVTLTIRSRGDRLRGCIGSLSPWRPLADDVADNAVAAAVRDPRFPPVTAAELGGLRVEVSVLSPAEPIVFNSEEDLRAQLRPGVDGLILTSGARRGTFLPQVWEQLPEPEQFLDQLKVKAGLSPGWWDRRAQVSRYTVASWKEP